MTAAQGGVPGTLLVLGRIQATQDYVVTPGGTWPLSEVNVTTQDQTTTTTHTPAWAIVMVVLFIWFFLLSLLFLFARKTRIQGTIAVTVMHRSGQSYNEHLIVDSEMARHDTLQRAAYLQNLIGNARTRHMPM